MWRRRVRKDNIPDGEVSIHHLFCARETCYDPNNMMPKGNAPTERVWAIWYLYAQQFPISISLDELVPGDIEPYCVSIGDKYEPFCRLNEKETEWLLARKVGIK